MIGSRREIFLTCEVDQDMSRDRREGAEGRNRNEKEEPRHYIQMPIPNTEPEHWILQI